MPEEMLPHHHTDEYDIEYLKSTLEKTDFQAVADMFRQLGDCSRVQIFWLLCHCEECVINISALMGMTSPAVSHHLKLLKASGLITSRREGKEVYYKAADNIQSQSLHLIIEKIMEITCPEE